MKEEQAMENAAVVLVVEDDQSIQEIIQAALSEDGLQSAVVSTGEEALSLLRGGSNCRALVLDISFGYDRIKGWDVARRARAIHPALPVIYITGGGGHDLELQGVPNSVLLTKPFAPAELVKLVAHSF